MNNKFLETLTDSYLNKNSILVENLNVIQTEKFKSNVLVDLKEQLNILCENDRSIYEDLRKSSKVTQGIIIERYFDLIYKSEDYILESITEVYTNLEKNMFDLDYIYGEHFFENINLEDIDIIIDKLEELLEAEIGNDKLETPKDSTEKKFSKLELILTGISGVTLSPIVYKVLSSLISGTISLTSLVAGSALATSLGVTGLSILLFVFLLFRRKLNRQFFGLADKVTTYFKYIANAIINFSNYFKMRYAIMEKNTKNCYANSVGTLNSNI